MLQPGHRQLAGTHLHASQRNALHQVGGQLRESPHGAGLAAADAMRRSASNEAAG